MKWSLNQQKFCSKIHFEFQDPKDILVAKRLHYKTEFQGPDNAPDLKYGTLEICNHYQSNLLLCLLHLKYKVMTKKDDILH